jgi:hypothetical protein
VLHLAEDVSPDLHPGIRCPYLNARRCRGLDATLINLKGNLLVAHLEGQILAECAISPDTDYRSLSVDQIEALAAQAETYGYRKPKNLEGSTARRFHAFLIGRINGEWE